MRMCFHSATTSLYKVHSQKKVKGKKEGSNSCISEPKYLIVVKPNVKHEKHKKTTKL